MKVVKHISISRFAAQLVFLLLPTLAIVMFLLWNSTQYFSMLKEQWFKQSLYVGAGMGLSFLLYQFRFRFLPTFALLIFGLFSVYKILDNYAFGEFDGFFISVQFQLFAILFCLGWLMGWAFERLGYAAIIISGFLVLAGILLISKTGEITPFKLLEYFSPLALYCVYIIYTQFSLKQIEHTHGRFWLTYLSRMIVFLGVLLLLFRGVVWFLYPEIKAKTEEYGGGGKEGKDEMLKQNKDGTSENKESMSLNGQNKKSNNPEPLFCAHIESYLPNTDIPNPLYLTSYHFSKFDTLTETFERDTAFKYNDEFVPDPSKIGLFFTYKDSSKIRNAFSRKMRKTIEVEVYKKRLSPSAFLSPSTGYFVQPITVEKDFQTTFNSAYRCKSYVSDLNSAYFIYNTDDPMIRQFQEQRFTELRKAKPNSSIDPAFFNYYTSFSSDGIYKPVKLLADSLARGKKHTIDKVLAVRDYFLQKNEFGDKVFSYTDNPGVPGLPGASKLLYFLFESKKGYCAYYAAATVFILRSMKIPSRVVTGFLTVDRSDKNKGWYWFYEDQSHGWVQVYFPEYGWIDFDTTVGNDDAQQSPTPDGTPPLQPPNAILAAKGQIIDNDTINKLITLKVNELVYKDVEYHNLDRTLQFDVKVANVWSDSVKVSVKDLKKHTKVMAVSYAEKLKAFSPEKSVADLIKKLPVHIPTDDIYIKEDKKENNELVDPSKKKGGHGPWYYVKWIIAIGLNIFLFLFTLPILTLFYYTKKYRSATQLKTKAYYGYKASTFLLHQLQLPKSNLTYLQFAHQVVDTQFDTAFHRFMVAYLQLKYSHIPLSKDSEMFVTNFLTEFVPKVRRHYPVLIRVKRFLNLSWYITYFLKDQDARK